MAYFGDTAPPKLRNGSQHDGFR